MTSRFIHLFRKASNSIFNDKPHFLQHEDEAHLLHPNDESKDRWSHTHWTKQGSNSLVGSWSRRKVVHKFLLFVVLFLSITAIYGSFSSSKQTVKADTPRHMHVVLPASQANDRFCKTLLSAVILDYPSPIIVNWDKVFNDPRIGKTGGSHIAKIQGVLDYIETLGQERDDDLLLLVDGYDVWFQLRPEVMIKRYYEINALADKRIRNQLGAAVKAEHVSQRVLFSAQKKCWPTTGFSPKCWALPESSLPADVYGPGTDTDVGDPFNKYVAIRQRYLNSGLTLGPVGDLRRIFERAKEKVAKTPYVSSDQGIMAEMYGDQEVNRLRMAHKYRSIWRRIKDWASKQAGTYHSDFDLATDGTRLEGDIDADVEFGMGLDYENSIMHTSAFAEYDIAWLTFNDQDGVASILDKKHIDSPKSRKALSAVPAEVAASKAPFESLRDSDSQFGSWNDVSLSVNVKTGLIPALMHFNGPLKNRIETDWNKTWFHPHARSLLNAHVLESSGPIARVMVNGAETEWYGEDFDKGSVVTDAGGLERIGKICNASWNALFGDGQGTWVDRQGESLE